MLALGKILLPETPAKPAPTNGLYLASLGFSGIQDATLAYYVLGTTWEILCRRAWSGKAKAWKYTRQDVRLAFVCRFPFLFAVPTLLARSSSSLLRPLISVHSAPALPASTFSDPTRQYSSQSPHPRRPLPALFPMKRLRSLLEFCGRTWWAKYACLELNSFIRLISNFHQLSDPRVWVVLLLTLGTQPSSYFCLVFRMILY